MVEGDLLSLAAALERGSEHPLAKAIVEGAEAQGVARQEAEDFGVVTGKGGRGKVGGRIVALGNAAMMQEMGLDTAQAEAEADSLLAMGKTAMFIATDGALAGIVAVAGQSKDSVAQAIKELPAPRCAPMKSGPGDCHKGRPSEHWDRQPHDHSLPAASQKGLALHGIS